MAEKIKTVILYRQILSSKRTVHRQGLKAKIHRHMETSQKKRKSTEAGKVVICRGSGEVVIQSFRVRSLWQTCSLMRRDGIRIFESPEIRFNSF